jgi:CspA family cold shock protein
MVEYEQGSEDFDAETFEISGTVKWFNTVKGFGFVTPGDGKGDVFLHLSALREAGFDGVDQGATIVCEVVQRPKGLQAVRVVNVDTSTAVPVESRPERSEHASPHRREAPVLAEGDFLDATVKWFNPNKGYGFITQGEGTRDIFVHMETLRNVGITHLRRGQNVRVRVGQGPKGPQVAEIEADEE